jgi:hypothetical protein
MQVISSLNFCIGPVYLSMLSTGMTENVSVAALRMQFSRLNKFGATKEDAFSAIPLRAVAI